MTNYRPEPDRFFEKVDKARQWLLDLDRCAYDGWIRFVQKAGSLGW